MTERFWDGERQLWVYPSGDRVPDWQAMLETSAEDLESSQTDLAWFTGLSNPAAMTRICLARDIRAALAELRRCHEVIGAYVIAEAYADTLPDDEADAADMKFGQHYWEGAASYWAGENLLIRAHEAAKERMSEENPVQVEVLK